MLGNSATLLQLVLTGLVLCAAGLDMRWRIIPNWLTLAIALIAPLYWIASGLAFWPAMAWQMLVGFACFGLFALAFAANMMGGGDVKLIGALGLWFPAIPMARLLVLMALIGGVVGLIYWIGHKLLKRNTALEIPYGVAIAAAALCTLWEPNINHLGDDYSLVENTINHWGWPRDGRQKNCAAGWRAGHRHYHSFAGKVAFCSKHPASTANSS